MLGDNFPDLTRAGDEKVPERLFLSLSLSLSLSRSTSPSSLSSPSRLKEDCYLDERREPPVAGSNSLGRAAKARSRRQRAQPLARPAPDPVASTTGRHINFQRIESFRRRIKIN